MNNSSIKRSKKVLRKQFLTILVHDSKNLGISGQDILNTLYFFIHLCGPDSRRLKKDAYHQNVWHFARGYFIYLNINCFCAYLYSTTTPQTNKGVYILAILNLFLGSISSTNVRKAFTRAYSLLLKFYFINHFRL